METYRTAAGVLKSVGQILTGARSAGGPLRHRLHRQDVEQRLRGRHRLATISFIVFISINLGLINLFPIPLLDGGHLVFYAIEAVSGRKPGPSRPRNGVCGWGLLWYSV